MDSRLLTGLRIYPSDWMRGKFRDMAQTNGFTPLTPAQVQRYSRHLIMNGVGSAGQRKLIDAKVLIIGAGGLGSPVALYLALAGIGTLGILISIRLTYQIFSVRFCIQMQMSDGLK